MAPDLRRRGAGKRARATLLGEDEGAELLAASSAAEAGGAGLGTESKAPAETKAICSEQAEALHELLSDVLASRPNGAWTDEELAAVGHLVHEKVQRRTAPSVALIRKWMKANNYREDGAVAAARQNPRQTALLADAVRDATYKSADKDALLAPLMAAYNHAGRKKISNVAELRLKLRPLERDKAKAAAGATAAPAEALLDAKQLDDRIEALKEQVIGACARVCGAEADSGRQGTPAAPACASCLHACERAPAGCAAAPGTQRVIYTPAACCETETKRG